MKRLLLVLALMFSASLVAIQPVNAGEWCADGTWSNSSGKGTCSWHGGIQGNTTKKKTNSYNDPWGTTTNNDPWGTTKKKTNSYNDPWGTTTNNDPWGTTKKKTNSYNDPWGTSTNNDPWGTTKKKTGGYCSSFDRSYGRC
jgi:hypothetical protein